MTICKEIMNLQQLPAMYKKHIQGEGERCKTQAHNFFLRCDQCFASPTTALMSYCSYGSELIKPGFFAHMPDSMKRSRFTNMPETQTRGRLYKQVFLLSHILAARRLGRRGKSQSIEEFFSHLGNVALQLAGRTVLIIPGVAPIARTAQSQEEA